MTADAVLTFPSLVLKSGATDQAAWPAATGVSLRVTGALQIESGAKIDVSGASTSPSMPAAPAAYWAGGSHGGSGESASGTPGGVYDSVYRPQMAGSTGHHGAYHEARTGAAA